MPDVALDTILIGVVLWFAAGSDASWLADSTLSRAGRLSWVVAAGAFSYFAALWLLGFRLKDFMQRQACNSLSQLVHQSITDQQYLEIPCINILYKFYQAIFSKKLCNNIQPLQKNLDSQIDYYNNEKCKNSSRSCL
ncbi:hypothetical protein [Nitrosomonas sp.]|uniref:hypothetical protein n=1 Tax=Nitrosomonas sp. TaxID=42353 RepID=UPI0025F3F9BF|nr:hypothetical protein [Nitrosomonas sp.]